MILLPRPRTSSVRRTTMRTAAALLALAATAASAQRAPVDAPLADHPPPSARADAPSPSLPPDAPDRPTATRTGVVRSYLTNEFGDVDGIVATDGTIVRFPAHMTSALVRTLKPGDAFAAQGEGDPATGFRAYAIGRRDGPMLSESRPDPAARPPAPPESRGASLRPLDAHGTVIAVLRAPRGEFEGVVLDDGTVVRLPRSIGASQPPVAVGSRLVARGYGTRNAYGRGLRADAIGIDGQAVAEVTPRGPSGVTPPPRGPAPPSARDLVAPAPPRDAAAPPPPRDAVASAPPRDAAAPRPSHDVAPPPPDDAPPMPPAPAR